MRSSGFCIGFCMVLVAAAGCLRSTAFKCERDADCGASGQCEAVGFCSFPNATCVDSGRSFSDSAGQGLASTCVPAGDPPAPDAGIEPPQPDAPVASGCPADYAAVAGSAHVYKKLTNVTWDGAAAACKATSTSAYLAVPDDATELLDLDTAAMIVPFWVGLDDKVKLGTFVTQTGAMATFLPWAAGEPDNGKPGHPKLCVAAVSTSQIATDDCAVRHVAICECEP
ncbi:MAG TPA: C-type lectin domain-containing protein [Kofleriaceae bacterium]|nr:C-type lectin domain-containing protein [Kofleriaceae bacterium]